MGRQKRTNKAMQEVTVNRYFYKDYDELNEHLLYFKYTKDTEWPDAI
jgi:hypothetical protein